MAYEHFILIGNHSDFTLTALAEKIKGINWGSHQVTITPTSTAISISINGWQFEIEMNEEAYVLEESEEMANDHAQHHDLFEQIKSCQKRLEIGGDPDFDMEYFNDFCFILEKIESFQHTFTFNPHEGFMNL